MRPLPGGLRPFMASGRIGEREGGYFAASFTHSIKAEGPPAR